MSDINTGSTWRKCDLHIHTPYSRETKYGNETEKETWDKYVKDLKDNYEKGSILGINDYNSILGYKKLLEHYPHLQDYYTLLPVVEFRSDNVLFKIDNQSQKEKEKFLNVHIIFSNEVKTTDIQNIIDNIELTNEKLFSQEDIHDPNLKVPLKGVKDSLLKYRKIVDNKYFLAIGKNEFDTIDKEIKDNFLVGMHFMFAASPNLKAAKSRYDYVNNNFAKNKVYYLHCSDSHCFSSSIEQSRKIGHCYTWIKGNPCFETLRQAYYSYDSRIILSESKPIGAALRIEKISLDFPKASEVKTKSGSNETFCFSDRKYTLNLNPGLNCIIGGRGTGKSLLLQLVCKNNQELLDNDDDKKIVDKIIVNSQNNTWQNYVDIDNDSFDYYGQGKIESLYRNNEEFTQVIESNLDKFWEFQKDNDGSTFIELKNKKSRAIEDFKASIKEEINLIENKIKNDKEIKQLEKEISSHKKVVSIIKDDKYIETNKKIKETQEKIQEITSIRSLTKDWISKTSIMFSVDEPQTNSNDEKVKKYFSIHSEFIDGLEKHLEETEKKIEDADVYLKELEKDSIKLKRELEELLKSKNIEISNISEYTKAQEEVTKKEARLKELNEYNLKKEKSFDDLKTNFNTLSRQYVEQIESLIDNTEKILHGDTSGSEVKSLGFKVSQEFSYAMEEYSKYIKETFDINKNDFVSFKSKVKKDYSLLSHHLIETANEHDLQTSKKILDFFEASERNKKLYDLNYLLFRFDSTKYTEYSVLYKDKNLEDLSFGQRATAIILAILLLGTKPIIIDEPETHLDQRVISNELVDIIKKVKANRQIIFATHNANIVISADAEQIFILSDLTGRGRTKIANYAIEDVYDNNKKDELMLLEGSRDAFLLRENKYNI